MINEWRLARKGALWFALVAFTSKPRKGASSLAEAATKPKIGLNSVAGFISKYARVIGLHQKTSRF
jgi:hypothetical protein